MSHPEPLGRLHGAVLDCAEPAGVARFWGRLLGLRVQHEDGRWRVADLAFAPLDAVTAAGRAELPRTSFLTRSRDRQRSTVGAVVEVGVADPVGAADRVLRLGGLPVDGSWAEPGAVFSDPAGHHLQLVADETVPRPAPAPPPVFTRYVAIGDSSSEGLVDADGAGGWRGWADRLAARIAAGQPGPLEYANLAVSGYRMAEIRSTQLDRALAMEPDLLSVNGGMNDILNLRPSFTAIEENLAAVLEAATSQGVRVVTFTNPDISRANPVATAVRDRIVTLNEIIRRTALHHDVPVIDFENVPAASDPRLWGEDRLHINAAGHLRVAAALAWLLGLPDSNRQWAAAMDEPEAGGDGDERLETPTNRTSHLQWARRHFGPWVVKGIRGAGYRQGTECKRPDPTPVVIEHESPGP